jgi:hypothetical protein
MTTSQSQPKSSDGGEEVEMMGDATGNERASGEKEIRREKEKVSVWRKVVKVLMWTPPGCRWDPEKPPQFSMGMNVLFAFAGACECFYSLFVGGGCTGWRGGVEVRVFG